jgi:hypothetical protein
MILGPITLLDCAVFVFFLVPQLVWQVGIVTTLVTFVKVLPFLGMHASYFVDWLDGGILKLTTCLSHSIASQIYPGAMVDSERRAVAFCAACHCVSGYRYSLCEICIR